MSEFYVGCIVKNISYKYADMHNKLGVVTRLGSGKIGVKLDGEFNNYSSTGTYWFKRTQLQIVENVKVENISVKEEYNMDCNFKVVMVRVVTNNLDNLVDAETTDVIIPVKAYDTCICADEYVLIKTNCNNIALAQVIETTVEDSEKIPQAFILGPVLIQPYIQLRENCKKLEKLKEQLNKKVSEMQDMLLYETLAQKDESFKQLYDEYLGIKSNLN